MMGFLKVEMTDGQIVLVPDKEALAVLNAHTGEVLGLSVDAEGRITLSPSTDKAARIARGKAFFHRYRKTFEALAK